MKLWNPSSKQSAGSLWKGAVGIYYFTGLYYFRRHRINWWWETQDWKWGNLMVSRAQMEKSKNLALFSFMSSWTLKLFILLSVILLKWVFSHPVVTEELHCLVLQNGEDRNSSGFCPPFLVSSSLSTSQVAALWQKPLTEQLSSFLFQ